MSVKLRSKREAYQSDSRPVSELVPWVWQPGPGLILCKDGSVAAFYRMKGVEYGSTDMRTVDHIALQVRQALRVLDEQSMVWFFTVRREMSAEEIKIPASRSTAGVTRKLQAAWNHHIEKGTYYRNERYFALLRRPASGATTKYMDRLSGYTASGMNMARAALLAFRSSVVTQAQLRGELSQVEELCASLEQHGEQMEDILSVTGVSRVCGDDLTSLLHALVSPPHANARVVHDPDSYLDTGLPDCAIDVEDKRLVFSGIEQKHAVVLSLRTWPQTLMPGILDGLDSIQGSLVYSAAYQFISRDKAVAAIEKIRSYHKMLEVPLKAYISQAMTKRTPQASRPQHMRAVHETEEALASVDSVAWGRLNFTIVCYGKTGDEAEQVARRATQVVQKAGGLIIRESMHALSAWAGTLPGQWAEPVRWSLLNSNHLAALVPTRNVNPGPVENTWLKEQTERDSPAMTVFPTHYGSLYRHHAHAGGVGHTLIVGPTGAGKSVFVNFLLSQFRRYEPTRVIIIDKDYSAQVPTLLQGGEYIDLGDEGGAVKLNPMALLEDANEIGWATEWVEGLMGGDETLDPDQRDRLASALKATREIACNNPELYKLGTLYQHLDETLKLHLSDWVAVTGGRYARYFDHSEDSFRLSSLVAIEIGGLLNRSPRLARSTLDYIFRRIDRSLDGTPTIVYVEEAWFMLSDPKSAAKVEDWLRTLRKKNAGIWLATQSLEELENSSIGTVLVESTPTRIYLPNPEASKHAHLYSQSFGLNDWQIATIENAQSNSDYYIATPDGGRTVGCRLRGDLLAAMRSDTAARRKLHTAMQTGGENWQQTYFDLMQVA